MAVRLTVTRSGAPKKKRDNPEQRLTIAVKEFLDVALPSDATYWHTPNSIWTTVKQAGEHKAMGVKAGVADCVIVWRGRAYALELKGPKGRPSLNQENWGRTFRQAGGQYHLADSLEQVQSSLRYWGIPLRATVFGKGVATSAGSRRAA